MQAGTGIVEWAQYIPEAALPKEFLDIRLESCEKGRFLTVMAHGQASQALAQVAAYSLDHIRTARLPDGSAPFFVRTGAPMESGMKILVQKFGGTSVANLECMKKVREKVQAGLNKGYKMVVVLSARSGETNRLLALASEAVLPPPDPGAT